MVRYWFLRRKLLSVQFKTASWSRSWKGKIKQVKRIALAQDERSEPKPLIRKIMEETRSKESGTLQRFEERDSRQQSDTSILPSNESMRKSTTRTGLPRWSLYTDSEKSHNETFPALGIVYTQNVQGLTGKDKGLESLVDPIVDLMIKHNIMVYCIQETWTLGSCSTLVRGNMVLWHNRVQFEWWK